VKVIGGVLSVAIGAIVLVWVIYSAVSGRILTEKGNPLGALVFSLVMISVGGMWLKDSLPFLTKNAPKPKKGSKPRRRRTADEDA
jgi:hypothetical protein